MHDVPKDHYSTVGALPAGITIPPPRPKRKANAPYPRNDPCAPSISGRSNFMISQPALLLSANSGGAKEAGDVASVAQAGMSPP